MSIYDPCGRIALLIVPLNYEERYLTVVTQENTLNNYLDSSRPQTSASSAPTYSEKFLVDNKEQAEIHVYPEVAGKVVPLKTPLSKRGRTQPGTGCLPASCTSSAIPQDV